MKGVQKLSCEGRETRVICSRSVAKAGSGFAAETFQIKRGGQCDGVLARFGLGRDAEWDFPQRCDRALRGGIKAAQACDFVTEEFDAEGGVVGSGEDVDDAAAAGKGAGLVDHGGGSVAAAVESGEEGVEGEPSADLEPGEAESGVRAGGRGARALRQGLHVRDDERAVAAGCESGEDAQAGMTGGAFPRGALIRERLAGREEQKCVALMGWQPSAEVFHIVLREGGFRGDQEDRPVVQAPQGSDHGRFGAVGQAEGVGCSPGPRRRAADRLAHGRFDIGKQGR